MLSAGIRFSLSFPLFPSVCLYVGGGQAQRIASVCWANHYWSPEIAGQRSDKLLNKTIPIGSLLGEEVGIIESGGGTDGSLS